MDGSFSSVVVKVDPACGISIVLMFRNEWMGKDWIPQAVGQRREENRSYSKRVEKRGRCWREKNV